MQLRTVCKLTDVYKKRLAEALEWYIFHRVDGDTFACVYVNGPEGLEVRYRPGIYEGERACALKCVVPEYWELHEALWREFPLNEDDEHTEQECQAATKRIMALLPDELDVTDWEVDIRR